MTASKTSAPGGNARSGVAFLVGCFSLLMPITLLAVREPLTPADFVAATAAGLGIGFAVGIIAGRRQVYHAVAVGIPWTVVSWLNPKGAFESWDLTDALLFLGVLAVGGYFAARFASRESRRTNP